MQYSLAGAISALSPGCAMQTGTWHALYTPWACIRLHHCTVFLVTDGNAQLLGRPWDLLLQI